MYPIFVKRPHTSFRASPRFRERRSRIFNGNVHHHCEQTFHFFSLGHLTHFCVIGSHTFIANSPRRFTTFQVYQQARTTDCYYTHRFGQYPFCLEHHCTATYAVEFEDVLHAKKGGMSDNGIPVIITIPKPMLWFNSGRPAPKYAPTLSTVRKEHRLTSITPTQGLHI